MLKLTASWLCSAVIAALPSQHCCAQTLIDIGTLPGGYFIAPNAISNDGMTVAGQGDGPDTFVAFRWNILSGASDIGTLPGAYAAAAFACSADGNAICGYSVATGSTRAFRWTPSGMTNLGVLPGRTASHAYGMSADASTIVGHSSQRAFRWTAALGMRDIGLLPGGTISMAHATNGNGTVVTGFGNSTSGVRAFRWTQSGGMQSLGVLPGADATRGDCINANGDLISGQMNYIGGGAGVFVWSSTSGLRDLGHLPNTVLGTSTAIAADGSVVVGTCDTDHGQKVPFRWSEDTGMVDLNEYLPSIGLNLVGWVLRDCRGMSPNGLHLAGTGKYLGSDRSWIAHVPCVRAPQVTQPPLDAEMCMGGVVQLTVAASSTSAIQYRWFHNGAPLLDDSRITGTSSTQLRIIDVRLSDNGKYECRATNACGTTVSSANVRVCGGDLNCDGMVDFADYLAFLNLYESHHSLIDFNEDGLIDFLDYLEFLNLFDAGC